MSSTNKQATNALVDDLTLGDDDLSSLNLTASGEQYQSGDLDDLASIQAELLTNEETEIINEEHIETMEEEIFETEIEEEHEEDEETLEYEQLEEQLEEVQETILPDDEGLEEEEEDVEMSEPDDKPAENVVYTSATQNVVFQTKPTLQRIAANVQMKPSTTQIPQSQSIMIVSSAGGQGGSQILKISHPPNASPTQLQSLAQSIISGKAGETNIVQLRATSGAKTVTSSQPSTLTFSPMSPVKTVQAGVKRPVQVQQNRNVYPKIIASGNQTQPAAQIIVASASGDTQTTQGIKFLANNVSGANAGKTFTLAQAQQMGLITTSKMQHILPSTQKQQGIKIIQSTPSMKIVPSNVMKSPAKILPAPAITQIKPTIISANQAANITSGKTTLQQNPQKVIIRQSSLKPGTVISGSQVIRIPANQSIVANANQLQQLQMPGGQVQYVRLVGTPSGTNNVVTVSKPKNQTSGFGVAQKVPAPQQIVKVVPLNQSGGQTLRTVAPKTAISGTPQRLIIPATSTVNSQGKSTVAIPASALNQLAAGQAVISGNANMGNIVVLPTQYIQQATDDQSKSIVQSVAIPTTSSASQDKDDSSSQEEFSDGTLMALDKSQKNSDSNGIRPRKPCNCTKSQCLKLYCDCFANGEFCHMCNCNNCSNNLGNEEERQRAIKSCLERNPSAFRPKIGKSREVGEQIDIRRHNKGCNCKRSGCLKNYCECYEAKIPCSENCKCVGCRNIVEEAAISKKTLKDLAEAAEARGAKTMQISLNKTKLQLSEKAFRPPAASNAGPRQPFNFLTEKVVEITCQCLMAQAEEAEKAMLDDETAQSRIIEEFGRCLKEIIESAYKAETT